MGVAYLVLLVALVFTFLSFNRVRTYIDSSDQQRFNRAVLETKITIQRRIVRCVDQIYNVRALFAASQSVELEEWQAYFATMSLRHSDLGIRTLGYLEKVTPEGKAEFLRFRSLGNHTNITIIPAGDRQVYFPIVYVTHFDPVADTIYGLDHGTRPERLEAIEQAIDENRPIMTARTKFMGADGMHTNFGNMIYLPIYKNGAAATNTDQRRVTATGLIWMTIVPQTMLARLFAEQIQEDRGVDIEVFEGYKTTPDELLYDGDDLLRTGNTNVHAAITQQVAMPVLNRRWIISFSTTPAFDIRSPRYLQWLTLSGGLAMSFLLFGIARTQANARARAEHDEAVIAIEKERLAVTLFSIGDGVITTDMNANVLLINKVAEMLTGWSQKEAEGKPLADIFHLIQEDTREPAENPVSRVIKTGEVLELGNHIVLISRSGVERAIADSAAPIRDQEGRVTGVVLVFRDVTEKRKSVDRQFRESKLESLGLLAGGIAHDFNNMLAAIGGNIALARMPGNSPQEMTQLLSDAERAAFRARDLTQQLLTFAKGGEPIRKPAYLEHILRDACEFAISGSNVECEFHFSDDIWAADVDEGQFRQVINNLVLNARQAMPDGGKVTVQMENVKLTSEILAPLAAGNYVAISIADQGLGIKPDNLSKIFEPYFTTKKGGNGLGLATAYSIVRKHDGIIRVESRAGAGSMFQIYLPASNRPVPSASSELLRARFAGSGRILIMDDEVAMLKMLSAMLRKMGFEVETALDGAEALQRYTAAREAGKPFAAVIMDLTVPNGMGGREAIKRLREIDPEVRAIVSSGYSLDPVMANYREHGFRGVIPKPYHPQELTRALQEVIGSED